MQIILPKLAAREGAIDRIGRILASLGQECAWLVEIKEHKPTRSTQQNRFLWGIVYPAILEHLEGWEAEDVHEWCLGECFGWETLEGLGRKRVKPLKRSAKLTTTEFSDYISFIQRRMSEMGIYIPDPEEEFA